MTSERFVAFVLGRARFLLLAACVLGVVAGVRTVFTYAELRSALEELLPTNAPSVRALETARRRLPGLRHLGVVVDTGGPAGADAALAFLTDLGRRVSRYSQGEVGGVRGGIAEERRFVETYALQLMEPADVKRLREAAEARRDWEVTRATGADLLDEAEEPPPALPIAELSDKYAARYGKPHAFPGDRFLSDDRRTAVLVIQTGSQATDQRSDERLLARVQADVSELGFPAAYRADLRVGYAGDVATRVEEAHGLAVDLGISGVVVLALVVGVVVWFFRSAWAIFVLGVPVFVGTVATFGLVALPPLAIRSLNSNTAFLASIIVGNGINSGIVLLARFQEQTRGGESVSQALTTAVRETWRATLAVALAAAAAYGSLVFTDFRGFNQFGWIGGFGMLVCWGVTYLLVPPLVARSGTSLAARSSGNRSALASAIARGVLGKPGLVLAAAAVLVLLSFAGLAARRSDWLETDFSRLRRADSFKHGERYWGKRMDATLQRYLTPAVVITESAEQAARADAALRAVAQAGGAGGLIASVRSGASVLPPTRTAALVEARRLKEVLTPRMLAQLKPEERERVDRMLSEAALRELTAKDIPAVLAAGLRDADGRLDRNVLVFPALSSGTWDARRMAAFAHDVRAAAPSGAVVTGPLLLSSDIIDAMRGDGPRATLVALGAVLLVALFAFRSLGLSLASVASLTLGVLVMLGSMAWAGLKLNFANFVALPITFGIAADYSINVLKRYQASGDLGAAVGSTGGAVALCSATTIIGYGSLLMADNRALFSFGAFAVSGELACLGTAVLVLPAYLAWRRALPPSVPGDRAPLGEAEAWREGQPKRG